MTGLCALHPSYLALTIITSFFLALSLCLMGHFWYSMWRTNNTSKQTKLPRFYHIAIVVSNCLFCFHIIVNLAQSIILGTCDWDNYVFWGHFYGPSYFYGIILLLWIFVKRLKHVVHGSLFELSKGVYIYFQIIMVVYVFIAPAVPATWIYIPDYELGGEISIILWYICITIYCINSIFAMGLFINKFGKIIGLITSGGVTVTAQKQRLHNTQRILRRQTLLITIALSSTMFILVLNIVWFYLFYLDTMKYDYIAIWQCIDSVIGIICINVQFEHGEKFYKLCKLDKLENKIDKWILCFNKTITLNTSMTKSINHNGINMGQMQYKGDVRVKSTSPTVAQVESGTGKGAHETQTEYNTQLETTELETTEFETTKPDTTKTQTSTADV